MIIIMIIYHHTFENFAAKPAVKFDINVTVPWIGLWEAYISVVPEAAKAGNVTSERQKTANQANARHSTGPKTPEGKAVIRLNALRHGLLAREVVLPGEDADAFEELWNRVRADLSPVGPIE